MKSILSTKKKNQEVRGLSYDFYLRWRLLVLGDNLEGNMLIVNEAMAIFYVKSVFQGALIIFSLTLSFPI